MQRTPAGNVFGIHQGWCGQFRELREVVRNQAALLSSQRQRIEQLESELEDRVDELQADVASLRDSLEQLEGAHDADLPKQARRDPHG